MKNSGFFLTCGLIAFLLFNTLFNNCLGQEYNKFRRLSLSEGLSQATVFEAHVDVDGYLWIGTEDGLNKYDGQEILVYKHSKKDTNSISENNIKDIEEDQDGNIWLGTNFGLNKWSRKTGGFVNYIHSGEDGDLIKGNEIADVEIDDKARVWVLHENGLSVIDHKKNSAEQISLEALFTNEDGIDDITWHLARDSYGNFNLATVSGFYLIAQEDLSIQSITFPGWEAEKKPVIYDIEELNDGSLLIATEREMYKLNSREGKIRRADKIRRHFSDSTFFYDVMQDEDGVLWVMAYKDGVYKYFPESDRLEFPEELNNAIKGLEGTATLHPDSIGRIWLISMAQKTLCMWDPKQKSCHFFHHDANNKYSLPSSDITEFKARGDGTVFIGTKDAGLAIYNPRLETFKHFIPPYEKSKTLNSKSIYNMLMDSKGRLWLQGEGFAVYQFKGEQVDHEISLKNLDEDIFVYDFMEDKNGTVWIASGNGIGKVQEDDGKVKWYRPDDSDNYYSNHIWKLIATEKGVMAIQYIDFNSYLYNEEEDRFEPVDFFLEKYKDESLWSFEKLRDERYFVGNGNGFVIYDPSTGQEITEDYDFENINSISHPQVYDVYEDKEGVLWLATPNGLNKYDPGAREFRHYFSSDGLANQHVYQVLPDFNGNLWMSTNGGISKLNPKTNEFRNYNVNDGLQSDEFNGGAAYKDRDGVLYFGGINGINYFHPKDVTSPGKYPELLFTALEVNNKEIIPGDGSGILYSNINEQQRVVLPPGKEHFSVSFISINLTNPENIRYEYKLEGADEKWYDLKKRHKVFFNNLPPQDYVLKVRALNGDGQMSEVRELFFTLEPYFYETIWFKASSGGFVLLLLISGFWMRTNAIKRQKEKLEHQVKERTQEVVKERDEADKQRNLALEQKKKVSYQNAMIEEKNKELTDSINYAQKIQEAILTSREYWSGMFEDFFILYRPKDIVSGDFYWAYQTESGKKIWAVGDCTGHGVPGGFMSMIGNSLLNEIIIENKITEPDQILDRLNEGVMKALNSSGDEKRKDGMDISLCSIEPGMKKLKFSGAHNSLLILRQKEIIVLKADRQPIGYTADDPEPFSCREFDIEKGDMIYAFTDGYQDQFGGEKGKKYKSGRLKKFLQNLSDKSMTAQALHLEEEFEIWRKDVEQIDDVCIVGVKV